MSSFQFDIHTHTIASGHASTATITDMAKAAASRNLKMLGISDHGPATCGGGKPSYFRSLSYAQKERLGVEMLYGAEANILNNEGKLDLEDSILAKLDYVIASIHKPVKKPGTMEENTAAYIAAMKNPYVRIIGHCDDVKYPVDYLEIVKTAMKYDVLLEINNSSLSPDGYRGDTRFNDLMILNLCRHYHYPVIFASDSHGTKHVGDFTFSLELAQLAGMPDSLIMNYSLKAFKCFLERSRQDV
ncbi:phosphatase [Muricomes sp. OA1]|uniref:Phosphatase n=1 Tax=Hungatella hathewayi TaxID=154046 RepID=A0A3E2WWB9_9FIRM|nr:MULTISPECIES: phosphatase [Clostridia]MCH1975207.1 phosphatase [Muricomes sp. OA1]RGC32113.1 phosphatase [Hungatella hathewayi]GKH34041.1 phosphatase [Faecalicatena contorta]